MKFMLAASILAFVSACSDNIYQLDTVYKQQTLSLVEVKATQPAQEISGESQKPVVKKGAGIGSEVARQFASASKVNFSAGDYERMKNAAEEAINFSPTGDAVEWENYNSGRSGQVTVTKSINKDGRYCREFESEVLTGGGSVLMDGTACETGKYKWVLLDH